MTEEFIFSAIENRRLNRGMINAFVEESNDESLDELETQGGYCHNPNVRSYVPEKGAMKRECNVNEKGKRRQRQMKGRSGESRVG